MQVLVEYEQLRSLPGPLHLAIGVFDGLHLGHQAVINAAKTSAQETGGTVVVVTFDPHPAVILAPEHAPRLLTDTAHKVKVLEQDLGVGVVLLVKFDLQFAALSGEEFVSRLLEGAPQEGIARICVGQAWRFGKGRSGDVALLETLGSRYGFKVSGVETIECDGRRISSTRVRKAIAEGELAVAAQLLGRPYRVYGRVIMGRQLGRTIGFPTANLSVNGQQLPPAGVYAIRAMGSGDSWDGVANLGYRPTVEEGQSELRLEAHLFGLDFEIYGEELEIEFVSWIRAEQSFDGIEALRIQIAEDVAEAIKRLR